MNGQPNRLAQGGLINRDRPLSFEFDGSRYFGYAGDTLASALLASGRALVGRSFKYHRPRGIVTAGSEEPNALVELRQGARTEPNTRATIVELFEGLRATSQNRFPSLRWDLGALASVVSRFLPAGFYYKTFMWPAAFWEKVYEPFIRRAAGLGRASFDPDPDQYEKTHAFCDVLIVGGGPAGIAAALSAARAGARVILCDEDFRLGGRLCSDRRQIDDLTGVEWVVESENELRSFEDVRILQRTTVFGVYDGATYGAVERVSDHVSEPASHQPRQRLWKIVAKRAILASGAIERPIVFGGNDKPGVMLASAVRTYLNRYSVLPGRQAVVFTTTDDGWKTVSDMHACGVRVVAVVDARNVVNPEYASEADRLAIPIYAGARVVDAWGARRVQSVTIRAADGRSVEVGTDLVAMSGGWTPNIALTTHLGTKPRWSDCIDAFVPGDLRGIHRVIGAAGAEFSLAGALQQGHLIGSEVAAELGFDATGRRPRAFKADRENTETTSQSIASNFRGKAFIDFQNDVTQEDIELAAREGFRSPELVKRYTTLGMATDQGKLSNLNGHAVLAAILQRSSAEVGTTVFRPPYTPVALGAFAGAQRAEHYRPGRYTPGHAWAKGQGAVFAETGDWLRAQWFPKSGESTWLDSVNREVRMTRGGVGVCDVSTLGKIEIQGADAAAFLDRIYINTFSTLAPGRLRYGVMLREDGFVMDDGTTAHLAQGRYVMSTTTANAAKVFQHLEFARQVLWPELDVEFVSVTDQWAQYSIAGPRSRELLQKILGGAINLSNEAFAYQACAEVEWEGITLRIFRVSFSGELAYEIAVPARFGDAAVRILMAAGEEFDITPYGVESLSVMRIEKGHIAGNELNGTTTATDLGLGRMMSRTKGFIGRVLAGRPALMSADRPTLVGLKPIEQGARLHAGAHLLPSEVRPSLSQDLGYVTSVAYSATLGSWIGLGLLSGGMMHLGKRIHLFDPLRDNSIPVEVVSPVHFDPTGTRLKS